MSIDELSTEQRIKAAAKKIFQQKGYSATKTRDIAQEADINLALLNYYFRSKEKLYKIIMLETLQEFFSAVLFFMNDEQTSLKQKLNAFVNHYIDTITSNQDIPLFLLNEVKNNPNEFAKALNIKEKILTSVFVEQFHAEVRKGNIPAIHPIHFMLNLSGMVIFPFLAYPMLNSVGGIDKNHFDSIVQDRKKYIPLWLESMTKMKG